MQRKLWIVQGRNIHTYILTYIHTYIQDAVKLSEAGSFVYAKEALDRARKEYMAAGEESQGELNQLVGLERWIVAQQQEMEEEVFVCVCVCVSV